jgi:hypothetical protein
MDPLSSNSCLASRLEPQLLPDLCRLQRGWLWVFLALGIGGITSAACFAQDIKIGVTYVCNGEREYAESCNMRDTSDTSTCMVAHPDRPQHNGFMAYTTETRGSLKKLFPTCKQPTAQEVASADAFQKKQQAAYDANRQEAEAQLNNPANTAMMQGSRAGYGSAAAQVTPPKNAEERAMRRCVSSGRLPATCTGNSLLGAFGQMIGQFLPEVAKEPAPGPDMAGAYEGAGNWRLDFIDGGVLVNCSFLSPNEEMYTIDFKTGRPTITIDTRPKPLVLTLRADGNIVGPPGPVTIEGVVAGGSSGGGSTAGHTESHDATTHEQINAYQVTAGNAGNVTNTGGGTYDLATTTTQSTYVPGTYSAPHTTFVPKRATCTAINVSTKGAGTGVQTMQTDLLKKVFNDGDSGPATPAGIRMHGIFAAPSTGFSAQFFPESVILGCGPDSARAYPYTVVADSGKAAIKVNAPDHPLTLAFRPDGSLDAGSGPYQVHGRIVIGQNDNGDFTFAPMETTCNLAVLTPSKEIPTSGGMAAAATMTASTSGGGGLSTPQSPLGNATLSIVSGLPAQAGAPNPLAGRSYILLRDKYGDALAKGGVTVPAGVSPYKYAGQACGTKSPDCPKVSAAIQASAASAVRADANGSGTFPGVPPGTYYLMISAIVNQKPLVWNQAVQLKAGANTVTLDPRTATPLN